MLTTHHRHRPPGRPVAPPHSRTRHRASRRPSTGRRLTGADPVHLRPSRPWSSSSCTASQ